MFHPIAQPPANCAILSYISVKHLHCNGVCFKIRKRKMSLLFYLTRLTMKKFLSSLRRKQPTRCNNFHLLILLLIYLNLLYMFRVTNSPIFRSTFDCMYSFWYNALILLPTGDKVEMEMISSISTLSPVGSNIRTLYQKLYIQSKVLLKMGEFVARNT